MTPKQQTKLKNNATYWQKRYSTIEQAAHDKSVACFNELSEKYRRAEAEINKEINAWYQRFAVNNKISMTEARRLLNSNELEELKWNVEQYIKAGRENAIDKCWMKELENASAKFHINRLEALKLNAQQSIEKMLGGASDNVDSMLRDVYRTSFYRSCFELQKGSGIGFDVSQINENYLDKILSKSWCVDGSNFSDRIWKEKTKLVNTLDNELTRLAITGDDPKTAIDNISKAMNVSKANASRIIMTEQAYFTSRAQADSFKELDVEMFEVCSALDSLTCSLCAELDGTHYAMTDFKPGLTAPPFHPNCRCVTVPYFDDEFDNTGERAARGKDDKTYYVPADMTYKDWKKSFVDGDKTGLQEISANGIISFQESLPTKAAKFLSQEQVIEIAKAFVMSSDYDKCSTFQEIRAVTNKKLGYDALPEILSEEEFNKIINDKTILYRGIHANGKKTPAQIINEFKYGELWTGNTGGAMYGNGIYFTETESIAIGDYAGNGGEVITAVLKEDAKVADFLELANEYLNLRKITEGDFLQIISDYGQYAALKGYDAIALNGFNGKDYIVVLNRGKLIVKE